MHGCGEIIVEEEIDSADDLEHRQDTAQCQSLLMALQPSQFMSNQTIDIALVSQLCNSSTVRWNLNKLVGLLHRKAH